MTARPIRGEDNQASKLQSEWVRIPEACNLASLSRSTLCAHFDTAGGTIKTASIRKRGATRGIRMVSVPSLFAWLDSYAEQPFTI